MAHLLAAVAAAVAAHEGACCCCLLYAAWFVVVKLTPHRARMRIWSSGLVHTLTLSRDAEEWCEGTDLTPEPEGGRPCWSPPSAAGEVA